MVKDEYYPICPKCHSRNVHSDLSTNIITQGGSGMICEDCGYFATVFPEISEIKNSKIKTKKIPVSETPSPKNCKQ